MRLIGTLNNEYRITFQDEKQYELLCKSILKDKDGCKVKIEIKKLSGDKSLRQLGYYYGCIIPTILDFQGNQHTKKEVSKLHFELKEMFFFEETINTFTKQPQRQVKSLSEASLEEMSKYITDVIVFCNTELNIIIPSSEEYYQQ